MKQSEVIQHVSQQATDQGLTSEEATKLLQETLEYNGLPAIGDTLPSSSSSSGSSSGSSGSSSAAVPGLPVPGTLEHSMALTLFNAQQYVNSMFTKTGDTDSSDSSGIMAAVSSLPQSLSSAAVSVLKFVSPSQQKTDPASAAAISTGLPGQTYSEVVTGVDPAYAALGVLTTGALGSVAYSYLASDSDIASSATNLALGAVDAIARNDVVQGLTSNTLVKKALDTLTGAEQPEILEMKEPGYYYYDYDIGYSDYDYDYSNDRYSNKDPLYSHDRFSKKDPIFSESQQVKTKTDRTSKIPADIEWYEPDLTNHQDETSIPYITYEETHNPWNLMNKGKDTKHLYRSME